MRVSTSNNTTDSSDHTEVAAIQLDAVSVRYHLFHGGRPQLQDYAAAVLARRTLRREVWALRDVSLNIRRGEVFGLCGANGSGKSTLLKVVARILRPTAGRIVVRGRVAPLIELGAGFQHDLTGRENILLKSAILGYSERDTRQRIDRIVDFAGLREFIDAPVRTYSSGMVARLAFSVATDVQPDILIVDEVLAVGDAEFRERSEDRINELRRAGATVLIVSHNSSALRRLCDRVAWLAYGSMQLLGEPAATIRAYESGLRTTISDDDDILTDSSTPHVQALRPDDTMFSLALPGVASTPLMATVAEHFDPQHICPYQSRAEIPPPAVGSVAPFRLLHGSFFYDQIARMLRRAPVMVLELPAALPQPAHGPWATAENPLTRLLGQRAEESGPVRQDQHYLAQALTQEDFRRAKATLDQVAYVGLTERPRESLLLLWYTFGWQPTRELPALVAQPNPAHNDTALLDRSRDTTLYAHAVRRFTRHFDAMAQDLIERYGGPLTEQLEPPYPLELLHGLLRARYDRLQAQTQPQPALRFTFDRPVPGTGWYGVEYSPQHGTFRWTGPEPIATIQLPITRSYANQDLRMRCRILLASRPAILRNLRFSINHRPISITQTHAWDSSIICEGIIASSLLAGSAFVQIALEVDRTEVPPATGTEFKETRQLGVAVSWLELAPYVDTSAPAELVP